MEGSKSSSTTMQVSFVCQRCCQPLKLDTSFNVLDRVTIQELIGTGCSFVCIILPLLCTFVVTIFMASDLTFPFISPAPVVTVTPSKQTDSSEGDTAQEVNETKKC